MSRISFVSILLMVSFVAVSLGQQAPTISISDEATYSVAENTTPVTSFTVSPGNADVELVGTGLSLSGSDGSYSIAFEMAPNYEDGGQTSHEFTVTATDATDSNLITTVSGTVTVTDVDEPPTDITGDSPDAIAEVISDTDTQTRTTSTSLTATDPELRGISWSISDSDVTYFEIDNDGALSFSVDTPNYETKSSYSVTVTATDDGGQKKTRTITVQVSNVEEPGEVTFSPTSVRAGQTVTAKVTDPDAPTGITGVIRWSWTGGEAAGTTSNSYTTVPEDAGEELTVTVTYYDPAIENGIADTIVAAVTVLPAANNPPVVRSDSGRSTISYDENSMATIGFSAVDSDDVVLDWSVSDMVNFTITSGDDADSSKLANLTFNAVPDYEEGMKSYTVTVSASDGTATGSFPITINIRDVDEPGTVALSPSRELRVGDTVTATLTDPDIPVTDLTWQWKRDDVDIPDAMSASYTAVVDDEETTLRVIASYTDEFGVHPMLTSDPITVKLRADALGTVELNPSSGLRVGDMVTATLTDEDANSAQLAAASWQWTRGGDDIADAMLASYTAVEADEGTTLSVTATYDDGIGSDMDTAEGDVGRVLT